jgi:hypothetical protein
MSKTTVLHRVKRLSDVILSIVKADYGRNKRTLLISSSFEFSPFSTCKMRGRFVNNNNYWRMADLGLALLCLRQADTQMVGGCC